MRKGTDFMFYRRVASLIPSDMIAENVLTAYSTEFSLTHEQSQLDKIF